jgi:hypothetical protein
MVIGAENQWPAALFFGIIFILQAAKTHSFNKTGVFTTIDPEKKLSIDFQFF